MSQDPKPEVIRSDVSEPAAGPRRDATIVTVVYVLYLVSFLTALTAIAGVIIAYLKRGEADSVSGSHFVYQIRTFWIGLLLTVIGVLTAPIGIGFLVFLALLVWALVRCIKGLMANNDNRAIEQPETWLW